MSKGIRDMGEEEYGPTARRRTELERQKAAPKDWAVQDSGVRTSDTPTSSPDVNHRFQRRDYDNGPLRAALDAYPIHQDTLDEARICGQFMARSCPEREYARAAHEDRVDFLNTTVRVSAHLLGIETWLIARDPNPEAIEDGWTVDHAFAINERVLSSDRSTWLVEVVAHELRHQWQIEVMQGKRDHPDGETGRQRLLVADADRAIGNADLMRSYWTNELELDSEAFARAAVDAYKKESIDLRKEDLRGSLGETTIKKYNEGLKKDDTL